MITIYGTSMYDSATIYGSDELLEIIQKYYGSNAASARFSYTVENYRGGAEWCLSDITVYDEKSHSLSELDEVESDYTCLLDELEHHEISSITFPKEFDVSF